MDYTRSEFISTLDKLVERLTSKGSEFKKAAILCVGRFEGERAANLTRKAKVYYEAARYLDINTTVGIEVFDFISDEEQWDRRRFLGALMNAVLWLEGRIIKYAIDAPEDDVETAILAHRQAIAQLRDIHEVL